MTIIGFNFTKIDAEKKASSKGKISISNNVSITNVAEKELSITSDKQKVINFTFEFVSRYDPDMGMIKLVGDVLYMDETKNAKSIVDQWKKEKKIPKEVTMKVLNTVLGKCNIHALILSEQLTLPPPIPLPKVKPSP